jgi:hydroxylaminobenzene mutase
VNLEPLTDARLTRRLAIAGALLILLGLLTGIYASAGLTGKLPVAGRTALAAHLSALMGSFFIFGLGWSLPLVQLSRGARSALTWVVILSQYANWLITTVKAAVHVSGIEPTADMRNNVVFGLLTLLVVLPSLGAAVVWVYGLTRARG